MKPSENNNSSIRISVVVCTYNRADVLGICLDSLVGQTLAPELYEVIVVNNNSTDSTAEIAGEFVRKHKHFRLINESQQGLSHARNRGWKEARGKYVAYIDDDAKATPDWLGRIVDAFEKIEPKPVAVGGPIFPYYIEKMPDWFSDDFEKLTWGDSKGFLVSDQLARGFYGSNMIIDRTLFLDYGGFSEKYGMKGKKIGMGEESEFFSRFCEDKPYFWYDPDIRIYHYTPLRNANVWWRMKRQFKAGISRANITGDCIFSKKYFKSWFNFIVWCCDMLYTIARVREMRRTVKIFQQISYRFGYLIGTLVASLNEKSKRRY